MPGAPPTDDDLRQEVELTRRELSRTVDQLADKLDVKAQAQRRGQAMADYARANTVPLAAGGLALLALLIAWLRLRNRGE
jgi:hypothetical protein